MKFDNCTLIIILHMLYDNIAHVVSQHLNMSYNNLDYKLLTGLIMLSDFCVFFKIDKKHSYK